MGGSEQGIEEKRFWRVRRRLLGGSGRRRFRTGGVILPRQLAWVRGGFIIAGRAG
jgi:hypothetical protein